MTGITTIIFGATGRVGSATARTARERGAKVVLALRDPQKSIPGLSPEQEHAAGFERVRADLSQPESVTEAVRKTGAKRAFIYPIFGRTPDHMRACITALKDAGIDFVVLLSSAAIEGDIRSVSPSSFVSFLHAQIEVSLDDIFGSGNYISVRPAYFASNALWWKEMVKEGEIKILYPEAKVDWITPGDIGRVCGSILAAGPRATGRKTFVQLIGPELVSLKEALDIIGKAIGREVKVTQIDEQEGLEWFVKQNGMPEPLAKGLVEMFKTRAQHDGKDEFYKGPVYEEAVANVSKYGGRQSTSLKEWVDENKHEFSV